MSVTNVLIYCSVHNSSDYTRDAFQSQPSEGAAQTQGPSGPNELTFFKTRTAAPNTESADLEIVFQHHPIDQMGDQNTDQCRGIQNKISRPYPFSSSVAEIIAIDQVNPKSPIPISIIGLLVPQCERTAKKWRCGAPAMIDGEGYCSKHISKSTFARIFGVQRGTITEAKAQELVEAICDKVGDQFVAAPFRRTPSDPSYSQPCQGTSESISIAAIDKPFHSESARSWYTLGDSHPRTHKEYVQSRV